MQLVAGNSDELHGLCTHPTDGSIFATACDSGDVKVWDGKKRQLLRATSFGFALRCASEPGNKCVASSLNATLG